MSYLEDPTSPASPAPAAAPTPTEPEPLHWTAQIHAILKARKPLLVSGKPGLGKTYAVQDFCYANGVPLFPVTFTLDSSAAEARGHFIQTARGTEWTDGPAVRAMKAGGLFLVNDVHLAGPDTLSFLSAIFDRPESVALALPDGCGTVIRPAAGYQIAATTNGRIQDLPEFLRSRLSCRVVAIDAAPAAVALVPERYRALLAKYDLREILTFAELEPAMGQKEAARAVFGDAAADVLYSASLGAR